MNFNDLTPEQIAQFEKEIEARKQAEKEQKAKEREAYKELVDKTVEENAELLQSLSATMLRVKQQVFDNFKAVVDLKNEYFKTKSDRQSDTFTNTKGTIRIKLGNRLNEGWDDTVDNGIDMVKEYLRS